MPTTARDGTSGILDLLAWPMQRLDSKHHGPTGAGGRPVTSGAVSCAEYSATGGGRRKSVTGHHRHLVVVAMEVLEADVRPRQRLQAAAGLGEHGVSRPPLELE